MIELVSTKEAVVAKMWNVDSTLFKTTASGLKYAIIQEGEGELVGKEKQTTVHYSGFLLDGTKFDSSVERDEPFTFVAGVGQVIPGWDEGITGMQVGGSRMLFIPPELTVGAIDPFAAIPENSTLTYSITLKEIK